MLDPKITERISPAYWRNSQLSVCRFSGGGIINGVHYILCPVTDDLVRTDIWNKELKDAMKRKAVEYAEKKKWDAIAQSGLFETIKEDKP